MLLKSLLRSTMAAGAAAGLVMGGLALTSGSQAVGATPPNITMTPAPSLTPSSGYTDQQTISITGSANTLFPAGQNVDILECADPGGNTLPTDASSCDGATQYPNTVFTASDGSFSVPSYTVYVLPNSDLAESPSGLQCGTVQVPCVLYIGLNQNDFTQPKVFSAPFVFNGGQKDPFPTSTALSSSANPVGLNTAVTYTASVTYIPDGGTVTFSDGTTAVCTAVPVNTTTGQATCSQTYPTGGSHTITASYSGDATYAKSTSKSLTEIVSSATTTTLTSSSNPSTFGSPVTLTATVAPTPDGGTVTFTDGTTTLCSAVTVSTSTGQATCSTSSLPVGTDNLTASYSGDTTGFKASSGSLSQVVKPVTTTTAVTSSLNPSTGGTPVTFTATVSPTPDGGTVTFTDGTTTLCSAVAVSTTTGKAGCTTSSVPVGTSTVTGTYSGDTDFAGSSGTVSQTVNQIATKTSVTSSSNPSSFGSPVTFTAVVSPTDNGGKVTFTDGTTTLCSSVALSGSAASCTVSNLAIGSHTVVASYSGDSTYAASSGSVTQVVNKALTSIAAAPALLMLNPLGLNLLTLNATLMANGSGVAGQTLVFTAGGTPICTATTNSSGVASCAELGNLTADLAIIAANGYTVTYAGNATYLPSSGNGGLIG